MCSFSYPSLSPPLLLTPETVEFERAGLPFLSVENLRFSRVDEEVDRLVDAEEGVGEGMRLWRELEWCP